MELTSRGRAIIAVSAVMTILASIAVILRFVARHKTRVRLSVDDYLATASMVFIVGMLVELILWVTLGGSGHHFYNLTTEEKTEFFKVFLSNEFTYGTTSPLVKLTILAFYWRLFPIRWFRIIVDVLICFCVAWGVTTIIVSGVQCVPLKKYWDPEVPGHCINGLAFVQGIQGINIFLDVSIFSLPWPMIWRLQRPWRDKLGLCGVFLLGAFAVTASCMRMWALTIIRDEDITYTIEEATIWTMIEPCIGLVCACGPIIWALLPKTLIHASKHSKSHSSGSSHSKSKSSPEPLSPNRDSHSTAGTDTSDARNSRHQPQVDSNSTLGEV